MTDLGLERLLCQIIPGLNPQQLHIASLAPTPDDHSKPPSQTATLQIFDPIPPKIAFDSDGQCTMKIPGERHPLVLDAHFWGFTPLNAVDSGEHAFDLIALSGLASHPFGSWKKQLTDTASQQATTFMWLRDQLPDDFPDTRVMIYGYDTKLLKSESFQTIEDLALSFIAQLRNIGKTQTFTKPLVIFAHSLGGLLVKRALCLLAEGGESESFMLEQIRLVFLFGVPSAGMEMAYLIPMVDGQPNQPLVRCLAKDDPDRFLQRLSDAFYGISRLRRIRLISAYETQRTRTAEEVSPGVWQRTGEFVILVPPESAIQKGPQSPKDVLPIDRNHSAMVKFTEEDNYYASIRALLRDIRANEHIAPESQAMPEMTTNGISGKETRIQSDKNDKDTVIKDGLKSLRFADMRYREDHITVAQGGSYAWLSKPAVGLRSWLLSDDRLYWIQGKPGSGKSTLMKHLSQNLRTIVGNDHSNQCEYLWIFFNARGSYLQKSFEGLLRSVLYQLGQKIPSIAQIVGDRCKTKEPGMRNIWTDGELRSIFELVREQITIDRPVVLFLDALDEFNGFPETIADFLSSLSSSTGQQKTLDIKICFSSRPWDVFVERFDKCCGIRLQDWTRPDIRRYADVRLQKILDAASLDSISESIQPRRERMANYIHENAQGVFLWVTLILDELTKLSHMPPQGLYAEMTKFPADLEDYYRFTLDRIPPKDKYDAFVLLELVLRNGEGRVELRDLYCAFGCEKGATFERCRQLLDIAHSEAQEVSSMVTQLKDLCGGLLEVVQVKPSFDKGVRSVVQFMHETAKAFVHRPGLRQYLACNSGQTLVWANGHHFWTKYWFASATSFSHDRYIGDLRITELLCAHSCLAEHTAGSHFGTFLDTVPESFFHCRRSESLEKSNIWINSRLSFAAVSGLQLYISHKLADKAKECSDGPALLLLNSDQTSPLAHMICAEIERRYRRKWNQFNLVDATLVDSSLVDSSLVATLQILIDHGLRLNKLVNGGSPLEHFFNGIDIWILMTGVWIFWSHHHADPDSLDEEGHTPLDKRVALLTHIGIRDQRVNDVTITMPGLFDSASLLVAAGGHLTKDGYKAYMRGGQRWLRDPGPIAAYLGNMSNEDIAKFEALMEMAPVLRNRPTRRELELLKTMYRKSTSTPLSTYVDLDSMSTHADLDSSSDESSKPKSSRLRNFFRRLKE
ncbi:hypothetical protein LTS15_010714 [Exophiala xenobiotica]|nr:hypothetical protein LTS15_010714 [Exophiala xenobiotica]